jgi:hypothetical protein
MKVIKCVQPFTQDVPARADFERAHNPPVLPPHLLQVILNKDTPVQCDPNVLPEPNHVMLNHLYALSIKVTHIRTVSIRACAGRRDGAVRHASVQEKVRHNAAVQADHAVNVLPSFPTHIR